MTDPALAAVQISESGGPMTDAALTALIEKWREAAGWEVTDGSPAFGQGLDQCADELEAVLARAVGPSAWQPIETAPRDKTLVLVALIRDGVIWRVSDATFSGLGWYTKSGEACHWRTHWMLLPQPPSPAVPPVVDPSEP